MATSSKVSDEVKKQSIRYSLAFFIVWTFPTLARIVQFFKEVHPVLVVLSGTTIGMQGFFNAIIYFRPRYQKCVKYDKWYQKVWTLVHSTIFFCCYSGDYTKDRVDYVGKTESITASSVVASRLASDLSAECAEEKDEEKDYDEWHSNHGSSNAGEATQTRAPTQVSWTNEASE